MSSDRVHAAVAAMRDGYAPLAAAGIDTLTHAELLAVQQELETLTRQLPVQTHRILARLAAEASPTELGARSLREVLAQRLRISRADARRRLADAEQLVRARPYPGNRWNPCWQPPRPPRPRAPGSSVSQTSIGVPAGWRWAWVPRTTIKSAASIRVSVRWMGVWSLMSMPSSASACAEG